MNCRLEAYAKATQCTQLLARSIKTLDAPIMSMQGLAVSGPSGGQHLRVRSVKGIVPTRFVFAALAKDLHSPDAFKIDHHPRIWNRERFYSLIGLMSGAAD